MHRRTWLLAMVSAWGLAAGCGRPFRAAPPPNGLHAGEGSGLGIENPLFVPPIDREFLWSQLVDVTDNYFQIEREDRMRSINGVLTEGRIDTRPRVGSTVLEPWRGDSTSGYEKIHATLQSIRRRAVLRVIPNEAGYLVDVTVQKELEDLNKPEHATAGGAALRHDGTIVRMEGPQARYSMPLGWIPLGRDCTLEQKMLAEIKARLSTVTPLERLDQVPVEAGREEIDAGERERPIVPNVDALQPPPR